MARVGEATHPTPQRISSSAPARRLSVSGGYVKEVVALTRAGVATVARLRT